jgi:hypothetical protein
VSYSEVLGHKSTRYIRVALRGILIVLDCIVSISLGYILYCDYFDLYCGGFNLFVMCACVCVCGFCNVCKCMCVFYNVWVFW